MASGAAPRRRVVKFLRAEPGEGVVWIRHTLRVFFRQPFGLAGLFSICALIFFALILIPVIGGAIPPILVPMAALLFMIATRRAAAGATPLPGAIAELLAGGRARLLELLKLGLAYFAASVAVLLLSLAVDGGSASAWMESVARAGGVAGTASAPASVAAAASTPGAMPAPPLPGARVVIGYLFRLALVALLSIPFWHAPALVFWGRQGWAKSLFFSTMAIWRNKGAFAIYGLAWFGLSLVFAMLFGVLAAVLGLPQPTSLATGLVVVAAISAFLTLMYTSLWFTFAGCFELDDEPAAA